jgi:hypothetical protein
MQSEAAVGTISVTIPGGPAMDLSVGLGWKPSLSTNVTGYNLNWGFTSGQCTNRLDVGNVTNVIARGLAPSTTYYFNIIGYDLAGDQSAPSNELAYTSPPALSLQPLSQGTNALQMSLNFQGCAGKNYIIKATQDFQQWTTVCTTNCTQNGPVVYITSDPAIYAKRFYRVGQQ